MHQHKIRSKQSSNSEPIFSCERLMAYIAKELAKEYVEALALDQSKEPKLEAKEKK